MHSSTLSTARPPKAKAGRAKKFDTWTRSELETFLAAEQVVEHAHADFWTFAAWTGMRLGEMVALQWDDISLDDATVTVRRAVGKGLEGRYDKEPKTDGSNRTVELDEPLVALLRAHRKAQTEHRLLLGLGWRDHGLTFCEVDGSPIDVSRQSRRWSDLIRRHAPGVKVKAIAFTIFGTLTARSYSTPVFGPISSANGSVTRRSRSHFSGTPTVTRAISATVSRDFGRLHDDDDADWNACRASARRPSRRSRPRSALHLPPRVRRVSGRYVRSMGRRSGTPTRRTRAEPSVL